MSVVWWRVGTAEEAPFQYALMLERPGKKPLLLDRFERNIDVFWSADSRHLAVTDYEGSNIAESFIVDVGYNLAFRRRYVAPHLPPAQADGHVYYRWLGWLDTTHTAMYVSGHTDTNPSHGFDYEFTYNIITKKFMSSKVLRDGEVYP